MKIKDWLNVTVAAIAMVALVIAGIILLPILIIMLTMFFAMVFSMAAFLWVVAFIDRWRL